MLFLNQELNFALLNKLLSHLISKSISASSKPLLFVFHCFEPICVLSFAWGKDNNMIDKYSSDSSSKLVKLRKSNLSAHSIHNCSIWNIYSNFYNRCWRQNFILFSTISHNFQSFSFGLIFQCKSPTLYGWKIF